MYFGGGIHDLCNWLVLLNVLLLNVPVLSATSTGSSFDFTLMETWFLNKEPFVNFVEHIAEPSQESHEVIFAVKQNNVDMLKLMLTEVSLPSPTRPHLSRSEIAEYTANKESVNYILKYLHSHGIYDIKISPYDEFIHASASVSVWNTLFNTTFYYFENCRLKETDVSKMEESMNTKSSRECTRMLRAYTYSLHTQLIDHVHSVFNTVQVAAVVDMPVTIQHVFSTNQHSQNKKKEDEDEGDAEFDEHYINDKSDNKDQHLGQDTTSDSIANSFSQLSRSIHSKSKFELKSIQPTLVNLAQFDTANDLTSQHITQHITGVAQRALSTSKHYNSLTDFVGTNTV